MNSIFGFLMIVGEPGYRQQPVVLLSRCERDSSRHLRKHSCGDTFFQPLNVPLRLRPGYYALQYSGSKFFAEVTAEKLTRVTLGYLQPLPSECLLNNISSFGGRYRVFRDSVSPVEISKEWRMAWGNPRNASIENQLCQSQNLGAQQACQAWNGDEASSIRSLLAFSQQGFSWINTQGDFAPTQRQYIGPQEIPCEERLAVLPGSYGIEDLTRGTEETGFHIKQTRPQQHAGPPEEIPKISLQSLD